MKAKYFPWTIPATSPMNLGRHKFLRGEPIRNKAFCARNRVGLLASAISELPPDLRQVCLLMDVLNYSTQEVADHVGVSNVAVRLRLFRAHRKLREKLNQKFPSARQRTVRVRPQSSHKLGEKKQSVRLHAKSLDLPAAGIETRLKRSSKLRLNQDELRNVYQIHRFPRFRW